MVRPITKDTVLCMSLAGRPSNIGTRFHNFLYAELGLNFVYKAFTTTDLAAAIAGIRALGIRGCGVSMPYREACIRHVDAMDGSAEAIQSVNTIVNTDGRLRAYLAIAKLLADQVPVDSSFAVIGGGGWPRPWWRRSAMRASTLVRWWPATPGRGRRWPTSTGTPGGLNWAPAGGSFW
jgi:shikimate dehydrogenase